MPASTATHENSQSTATEFEALIQTPAWEAFDVWMSDQLEGLESTWRSASSPKAWSETGRRSRRSIVR
jgi:hypothetical protein